MVKIIVDNKHKDKLNEIIKDDDKWVKLSDDDCVININTKPFNIAKSVLNQVLQMLRDCDIKDGDFEVVYPEKEGE